MATKPKVQALSAIAGFILFVKIISFHILSWLIYEYIVWPYNEQPSTWHQIIFFVFSSAKNNLHVC